MIFLEKECQVFNSKDKLDTFNFLVYEKALLLKKNRFYERSIKNLDRINVVCTDSLYDRVYYEKTLAYILLQNYDNASLLIQNYSLNNCKESNPSLLFLDLWVGIEQEDFYAVNQKFNQYVIDESLDSNLINTFYFEGNKMIDASKVSRFYWRVYFRIKEGKKGVQSMTMVAGTGGFITLSLITNQ